MEEKIPHKIFLFKNPITEDCDYRWLSQRSCSQLPPPKGRGLS